MKTESTEREDPKMQEVRVAIIGAGFISEYHLEALKHVPQAQVRLICDPRKQAAQEKAARFDIPETCPDSAEVLSRTDIDAVLVTTPDYTHRDLVVAAARSGKHVMVQKPMANTSAHCEEMITAARRAGIKLFVSFMHRYFPESMKAKEYIANGTIGEVHMVRMRNATSGPDWGSWFFQKGKVGGGVQFQLGTHGIDLIRYFAGEIREVSAVGKICVPQRRLKDESFHEVEIEDLVQAVYRAEEGTIISHEMTFSQYKGCDRFEAEIYGSRGTIFLRKPAGLLAICAESIGGNDWVIPRLESSPFGFRQHQTFIDDILQDRQPDASGEDGLATIRVAEGISHSMDEKKFVSVRG
jgi:predicted dehydrogenase